MSCPSIKRNEKTPKFNNIKINKKEFHKSKQAINLESIIIDQIVVSDKFNHSKEGYRYFTGYQEGEIVRPLCIILLQMSGCINILKTMEKTCLF